VNPTVHCGSLTTVVPAEVWLRDHKVGYAGTSLTLNVGVNICSIDVYKIIPAV